MINIFKFKHNNKLSSIAPHQLKPLINKTTIKIIITFALTTGLIASVVWAAFSDKGKVLGSSFSVASSDIKLLENTSGGTDTSNLKDEISGPTFSNVSQTWSQDYPIKLYNNGSQNLAVMSNSNYATANDPHELRSYINVEIFEWDDANLNGEIDSTEVGTSLGKKTIIKWKTEGIELANMNVGEIKGYVLRFTAQSMADTKQGKSGIFDFEFSAIGL